MAGCRNQASQREAYIRDLRLHEDRIYELQDYMTEYQELLCEQRKENAKLRKQLAEQGGTEDKREVSDAAAADEDDPGESSLLDRARRSGGGADADLPAIDLGEPEDLPEIDIDAPDVDGDLEQVPIGDLGELSRADRSQHTQLASANIGSVRDDIRSAVFDPPPRPTERADSCAMYTEQMPIEPGSGDHGTTLGLMAIVEPLTTDGSAGYFTGELSLMLVDPLASDDEWEISRWDYAPEEVETAWRDHSRRVLDLPLAAPPGTPLGRPLELWIRMIPTQQDRKILCSTAITLTDTVGLIGVPVSGGANSTDPDFVVSSGWTAADELDMAKTKKPVAQASSWQAATTLPPPAVARATATGADKRQQTAKRAPEWSPFR